MHSPIDLASRTITFRPDLQVMQPNDIRLFDDEGRAMNWLSLRLR